LEATPGTPARSLRVHILGASGSGTSTLGAALAAAADASHLDTDDFYWEPTDPPYETPRPPDVRLALLTEALECRTAWVLSGSLCGWGDPLIPRFEHVIFLLAPTALRLARLAARERQHFGEEAVAPGGAMHANHAAFLAWAAEYDAGGLGMRSRARHEAWLAALPCPVLRLDAERTVDAQLASVLRALGLAGPGS
jgi:adenylate kinase family enzyme